MLSGAVNGSAAVVLDVRRAAKDSQYQQIVGLATRGEPSLVSTRPEGALSAHELLGLAASVEANSTHALAAATVNGAIASGVTVARSENAIETTANGVTATVDGKAVAVGKRAFIAKRTEREVAPTPLASGEMATYVAVDGQLAGALVFSDEIRSNASSTVNALRTRGVRTVMMLTGDDRPTAEHVAAALGIDEVHANCLPADKVSIVFKAPGRPIAMVGDGVNDAPVLAAADVGIAMGARGATAASEAADIVILRDDISRVADSLAIGRQTVDIALQSIWIGLSLSMILMLLAAFGFVPAIVAHGCRKPSTSSSSSGRCAPRAPDKAPRKARIPRDQ